MTGVLVAVAALAVMAELIVSMADLLATGGGAC